MMRVSVHDDEEDFTPGLKLHTRIGTGVVVAIVAI
jgi:hypothetical protein